MGDRQSFASRRPKGLAILVAMIVIRMAPAPPLRAADPTTRLVGRWTLDREYSEFPTVIGFAVEVDAAALGTAGGASAGRRGGRSAGGASGLPIAYEGEQTLKILGDVTEEAEHPWPVLTIGAGDGVVTITDGDRQTRRLHPGKKDDEQRLADGGIATHTKWDKNALVVDYEVEKDRDVRYTYSRASAAAPLVVEVSFRGHGHGDTVRRSYLPDK
jgi:hypothetical protein